MAGIADFLDSLIGGFDLICYSLAIGSLFWGLFVLRPWHNQDVYSALLLQKTIVLFYKGGFWLAAAQLFKIILKVWLMTAVLERWPFPEFAGTTQFIGGIVRTILAVDFGGLLLSIPQQKSLFQATLDHCGHRCLADDYFRRLAGTWRRPL